MLRQFRYALNLVAHRVRGTNLPSRLSHAHAHANPSAGACGFVRAPEGHGLHVVRTTEAKVRVFRNGGHDMRHESNTVDWRMRTTKFTHYKGGAYYYVGTGIHTETDEKLAFYFDRTNHRLYARPVNMFFSTVDHDDETRWRFTATPEDELD